MRKPLASGILAHLADSHVQILVIRLIAHGMDSLNRTNRRLSTAVWCSSAFPRRALLDV